MAGFGPGVQDDWPGLHRISVLSALVLLGVDNVFVATCHTLKEWQHRVRFPVAPAFQVCLGAWIILAWCCVCPLQLFCQVTQEGMSTVHVTTLL